MKKNIAILGSTGSIGKSLINILKKDKENFSITLLSANKNYKELIKQAKLFNVKNIIITDFDSYSILKKKYKSDKIHIYNNFDCLNKVFNKKNDFIMSAISGLDGLKPTLKSIAFTKKILIANKESIICGWNLIQKKLKFYNVEFIPIDSEHFSIWSLINSNIKNNLNIEKIYITASGGPFYKYPIKKFEKITPKLALKHPNWNMGKKISIDSATMMNKIFEIIEAKNIFNKSFKDISILLHPDSYLHAIVKFSNGITKLLIHDTSMEIPIFNSIYNNSNKVLKSKKIEIKKLNNLNLSKIDVKRFPVVKILKLLPNKYSMFETVLLSSNDELVKLFLEGKIKFTEISNFIFKIIKLKEFTKYKKMRPKSINEVIKLSKIVRLKTRSLCI
jgi:1-deoxy-D-xylulose-5-phosphate reductoisomerase